jgi:sec-independent protein translocase protein TatA
MFDFSIWHLLILLVVVALVFGTGKLPKAAGDLAQGIKNFKQAMRETPDTTSAQRSRPADTRVQTERPAIAPKGEESEKTASAVRTEETVNHG